MTVLAAVVPRAMLETMNHNLPSAGTAGAGSVSVCRFQDRWVVSLTVLDAGVVDRMAAVDMCGFLLDL